MTDVLRGTGIGRRDFVKALGGGVLILVSAPALGVEAAAQGRNRWRSAVLFTPTFSSCPVAFTGSRPFVLLRQSSSLNALCGTESSRSEKPGVTSSSAQTGLNRIS